MGVVVSYFSGDAQSNEPDPVTGLTPKEKRLIQSTWSLVKKDLVGTGVELLSLYFKTYPHYLNYFPFKDVPLDQLKDNKKFHAHAANVMYSLSSVIDNLNDNEMLVNLLNKSGESHGRKNIPEQAYWDLKVSVLETLEKGLGSKLSKEAKEAWDKTLTVAFTVLIKSLKEHYTKPTTAD